MIDTGVAHERQVAEDATRTAPLPRVLIVEDDDALARGFERTLRKDGYDVEVALDGIAAARALAQRSFDVIVTDIDLPGMNGLGVVDAARARDLDVPIVLMTGKPSIDTAVQAIEHGALRYLVKPIDAQTLRTVASHAVRMYRMARAKRAALELMGGIDKLSGDQAGLAACFGRALHSMHVAYQPIVSWASRSVFGFEALLRSREPQLPHPGAVLDAAERLGRIHDLGRTVRRRAVAPFATELANRALRGATAADGEGGPLLFINLHTRDLLDEDLYDGDSPLASMARRVVLEITERASLHDIPDVGARVRRLREMGFRIAVDDLGAGYAGLTSFALLEPEVVKLDMSLVRNIHNEPTKRTLVRTMISMCKELGMLVVGEGVETVDERDALQDAGCDLMQGYLFARPGPPLPAPVW